MGRRGPARAARKTDSAGTHREAIVKLARFTAGGTTRIGVVVGAELVDLAAEAPELPREMSAFLAAGTPALDRAARAVQSAAKRLPLTAVRLEAPVPNPQK